MKTRIVPIVVLVALCAVFTWTRVTNVRMDRDHHRRELAAVTEQVALRLQEFFAFRIQVLAQLEDQYLDQDGVNEARFRHLSLQLQKRFPGFQAVSWLDADGIVRIPVPLKGNEAVLNRDIKEHPLAGKIVRDAIRERSYQQTGTLKLIQGQWGFACYLPVLADGQLKGLINGVFRYQKVMDACLSRDSGSIHSFQLFAGDQMVACFGDRCREDFGDAAAGFPLTVGASELSLSVISNSSLDGAGAQVANTLQFWLSLGLAFTLSVLVYHLYRSRESLRLSEEKTERILSLAQEGIWAFNDQGKVVFANHQLAQMLGFRDEQLVSEHFSRFIFDADMEEAERQFEWRRRGLAGAYDARLKAKNGEEIWTHMVATPVISPDGKYSGTLAMVSDQREKRQLQEQLRESQKMDALGRLAGGIAHDFNNILTVIMGANELVSASGPVNEKQEALIEEINSGSQRAARLIAQLLTFSRSQVVSKVPLDLCDLVQSMTPMLHRLLGQDIELRIALPHRVSKIMGERSQLEQVILNLAINARDAMAKRGTLSIRVQAGRSANTDDACVILEVEDTGPGIAPDLIGQVFEPFFTTKDIGQGTGLGLSTVHGILKSSNAEIQVHSPPGSGARFTITFPDCEAPTASAL